MDNKMYALNCYLQYQWDASGWIPPFSAIQADYITCQFKKYFRNHAKIANGIRRWPSNLAILAVKEKPSILPAMFTAGVEHEIERQKILKVMLSLVIQAKENHTICMMTPLEKLERQEFKGRQKYRFIRKYFSNLLPPRKRKNKKRSPSKLSRKEAKRAELRKIEKAKAGAKEKWKQKPKKDGKKGNVVLLDSGKTARLRYPKNAKILSVQMDTRDGRRFERRKSQDQRVSQQPAKSRLWGKPKPANTAATKTNDAESTPKGLQNKKKRPIQSFFGVDFQHGYSVAEFQKFAKNYQQKA